MVERKHEIRLLVKAVKKLNEIEKEIVLLRFVEELSYKEIAAMVGRKQSSCRVILHRALKALRLILAELEGAA
jgi:RNA polymerase sigma factor (sigma-70 family)